MDIYQTIIRPIVTEKSTHQTSQSHGRTRSRDGRGGSYSFQVHNEATKAQVREAVERIYNVKVVDVRTSKRPGKQRRYRYSVGRTADVKKAVVVLHPDYHIDLF
jgi:large subunit ribosomal protein L23